MRSLFAALAGGIFGAGLLVSGMTDAARVQGFFDVLGKWDPTLIFVMGGAIVPMAAAWALAARRTPLPGPVLAEAFPARPRPDISRALIVGSVLFGMGWGLTGLCPGPAMALLGFGGAGVWIFGAAMVLGMAIAPRLRGDLDAPLRTGLS